MQGWGVNMVASLGVLAGWFLACAGQDIPPIDDDLRGALGQEFGGAAGQTGTAGAAGASGGSGNAGSANAGSANAGSANAGGGAGGAGGGGGPVGGGGGGEVCDAFNTILLERCGTAGCHSEGVGQGAFAASEDVVEDFIDAPSTKGAACDQVFIDSTNPEDSLIYTRLFGTDCGGLLAMPLSGDPLTEEESDCVLSWLQQFAR